MSTTVTKMSLDCVDELLRRRLTTTVLPLFRYSRNNNETHAGSALALSSHIHIHTYAHTCASFTDFAFLLLSVTHTFCFHYYVPLCLIYLYALYFICMRVCVCACDCPWAFRASHSNSIFFIICQKQYASCRSQLRECVTRHQRFVTEAFLWAVVVGFCQLCNIASIRQTGILLSATCCCYCKCWYLFYNNKSNLSPRCALAVTLFESFFSNCRLI